VARGVAAYVGGWGGEQGDALAFAPGQCGWVDQFVKLEEGPRFSAWLSASSPSRRRPPLRSALQAWLSMQAGRMVREDEHTNTTQPVPCYGNSRRRTVQHATLHTCTVS